MIFKIFSYLQKKMEVLWSGKYKGDENITVYNYKNSVALKTSSDFGKKFKDEFKNIDGKFNRYLSFEKDDIGVPIKTSGWIFKKDRANELINLLEDIIDGKDLTNPSLKIYEKLRELKDLIENVEGKYILPNTNSDTKIIVCVKNKDEIDENDNFHYKFETKDNKVCIVSD